MEFGWPIATTIMGIMGTLCVALIRAVPRRINDREIGEVVTRLRVVEQEVKYLRVAIDRIERAIGKKPL